MTDLNFTNGSTFVSALIFFVSSSSQKNVAPMESFACLEKVAQADEQTDEMKCQTCLCALLSAREKLKLIVAHLLAVLNCI